MATTTGKVVAIGCAIGAVLAILGIAAVIVMLFIGRQAVTQVQQVQLPATQNASKPSAQSGSLAATSSTEPSLSTAPPPTPVTNESVFLFRDPFRPLITEPPPTSTASSEAAETTETSEATTSTASSTTTSTGEANVLTLQDIVTVDGKQKAVLDWQGETFTLGAGEVVDDSPWKVLSVGTSSVTMLFGDVQVTLSVGEATIQSK
jgi:hypothetical protein